MSGIFLLDNFMQKDRAILSFFWGCRLMLSTLDSVPIPQKNSIFTRKTVFTNNKNRSG